MNEDRKGDWLQTYMGHMIWPADPRVGDFDIYDIAHHTSHLCRFVGACRNYYSVAEHSVWVSYECAPEDALEGLLHDASEAYLGDMVTSVKRLIPEYKALEKKMEAVIAEQFGIRYPWPASVQRADLAVLMAEARDNMGRPPKAWSIEIPPMTRQIECWGPEEARSRFLMRFDELMQRRV